MTSISSTTASRRRCTSLLVAIALAIGILAGAEAPAERADAASSAASVGSSGLAQAAGVYPGYSDMVALRGFESWLGRDVNYVVQFGDQVEANFLGSIWGQVTKADQLQTIAGRVQLVESVPLAFGRQLDANTPAGQATAAANLQTTANGANDSKFRQAALYLQQGGYGDAIIRIGWEFDGGWYPWSSNGNCALWQTAFRRVHDVFASVSPAFRFDWNGNSTSLKTQASSAYPGDAYVDIIGLDNYDMGLSAPYNPTTHTWADPTTAFTTAITPNLQFQRDFAIAHNKQVSFPEWGLFSGDGHILGGGDNPVYIQRMHDWMAALPTTGAGSLAYQSYFNYDSGSGGQFASRDFPRSQALYRTLFSAADVPTATTTPPTTAPPTTTPPATTRPTTTTTTPVAPTTTVAPSSTSGTTTTTTPKGASVSASDEFGAASLNTGLWSKVDPVGNSSVSLNGTSALLSVPAGTAHDPWIGGNTALRIVQPMTNTDFEVEAKFDTLPTRAYSGQGILVQESPSKYVRFDVVSDGAAKRLFSASFTGGTPTVRSDAKIGAESGGFWLRVKRVGSTWSSSWSTNGTTWTAGPTYSFAMTVTATGPFAANAGHNPAWTSSVDYFHTTKTSTATTTTSPSAAGASVGASVSASDEFGAASLNTGLWSKVDPVGNSSVSLNGTSALLSVPAGTAHDPWIGGNTALRIVQPMTNTDFEVEAKFDTLPTRAYSGQGILVQESPSKYVRFDVVSDGAAKRLFSASFTGGTPTVRSDAKIGAESGGFWLRVKRVGSTWSSSWSTNGTTWTAGPTYSFAMTVTATGPFAANAGHNPAWTSSVDYFHTTKTGASN